jgi:preprotein translocase subunit SecD
MTDNLRGRTVLVFLYLAFCTLYLLPSVVNLPQGWWFNKKKLNYGLDIQGGAHLVYGVDVAGVVAERTQRMSRALNTEFKEKNIDATASATEKQDAIVIHPKGEGSVAKVTAHLKEQHGTTLQVIDEGADKVEVKYFDAVMQQFKDQIINQAIEVIRNRVDEFGVAEPTIAAQGSDRILVQLPGITDAARAKELINKTARLDFRLVDQTLTPDNVSAMVADAEKAGNFALAKDGLSYNAYVKKVNEALKDKLPKNTMVSFEKARNATSMEAGKVPYLLRTDTDVSGDQLEDAYVSYGQYGEPNVSFRFGSEGRRKFADVTEKNIGHQLAIVLDDVIYSAPNIQSRIDGQGQITLGRSSGDEAMKEGQLIATALRAGALPAALTQYEERSVGPSLGADSIERGKRAALIGILLTVVFISIYYKASGMVAGAGLILNVFGLMAVLAALGATLTLPGIAGITLTVGMAVDANVLIYERIKEELAKGMAMKAAIHDGFNHAWSAIFDANVTHGIAASVLIYFGSGPVRGFGTTLIAGIITTMITSIFITRYLLDVLVNMSKNKSVSI